MNEYMQKVCDVVRGETDYTDDFPSGFEAAHDILLPLLVEALPNLVLLDAGNSNDDLVRRIKQVTEEP